MLVSKNPVETNKYELIVSVPAEEFAAACDKVFKKRAKQFQVPGFRKGKAPRKTIEKLYGEGVFFEEAVNDIAPVALQAAYDESGLEIVVRPEVEVTAVSKEEGVTMKAICIVKPEVVVKNYKGIKASKDVAPVTDEEVDGLFQKYLQIEKKPRISREGLRLWYDGYQAASGKRLYNPRSVVSALSDNQLGSYWASSGPYDEIFYYIGANVDAVKDDIALMIADNPVPAKVQEYAATSMELKTRDEIFSAMVVYGFLNYENGYVSIPNKELMDKFAEVVQREPSMGNVYKLTKESGRMLAATKAGDVKTMTELMEYAHNILYENKRHECKVEVLREKL